MNQTKTNRGITLVALVITIIVLIILAGVSINAVLNGGIITNAKDAKNKYNEGKVKEETALIDLEVQSDIEALTKNSVNTYKFQNNYMTGISTEEYTGQELTVSSFKKSLPDGYEIYLEDGSEVPDQSSWVVSNGMIIKKGDKQVGRIIIYGDIDSSGTIGFDDLVASIPAISDKAYNEYEDYQLIAMDVNHDGKINMDDLEQMRRYGVDEDETALPNQDVAAPDPSTLIIE